MFHCLFAMHKFCGYAELYISIFLWNVNKLCSWRLYKVLMNLVYFVAVVYFGNESLVLTRLFVTWSSIICRVFTGWPPSQCLCMPLIKPKRPKRPSVFVKWSVLFIQDSYEDLQHCYGGDYCLVHLFLPGIWQRHTYFSAGSQCRWRKHVFWYLHSVANIQVGSHVISLLYLSFVVWNKGQCDSEHFFIIAPR